MATLGGQSGALQGDGTARPCGCCGVVPSPCCEGDEHGYLLVEKLPGGANKYRLVPSMGLTLSATLTESNDHPEGPSSISLSVPVSALSDAVGRAFLCDPDPIPEGQPNAGLYRASGFLAERGVGTDDLSSLPQPTAAYEYEGSSGTESGSIVARWTRLAVNAIGVDAIWLFEAADNPGTIIGAGTAVQAGAVVDFRDLPSTGKVARGSVYLRGIASPAITPFVLLARDGVCVSDPNTTPGALSPMVFAGEGEELANLAYNGSPYTQQAAATLTTAGAPVVCPGVTEGFTSQPCPNVIDPVLPPPDDECCDPPSDSGWAFSASARHRHGAAWEITDHRANGTVRTRWQGDIFYDAPAPALQSDCKGSQSGMTPTSPPVASVGYALRWDYPAGGGTPTLTNTHYALTAFMGEAAAFGPSGSRIVLVIREGSSSTSVILAQVTLTGAPGGGSLVRSGTAGGLPSMVETTAANAAQPNTGTPFYVNLGWNLRTPGAIVNGKQVELGHSVFAQGYARCEDIVAGDAAVTGEGCAGCGSGNTGF